jgi:dihydrofolate reductase
MSPITGHVFIAASLDGFIARPDGGIDWLNPYAATGEDHGYHTFMKAMDGIVMGRGTFETALSFGGWPYEKPVTVMSTTLTEKDLRPDLAAKVQIETASPEAVMAKLAAHGMRRVYVDGGKLIQSFLRTGLIAELVVTHVPILLGQGVPLFGALAHDVALRHLGTASFPSGLVQSKYEIIPRG